jgi:hypothetical protein
MTLPTPDFDIFLSHSLKDRELAAAITERFKDAGLAVFTIWEQAAAGEKLADRAWLALAESAALVVLVTSDSSANASLALDVGAAKAWNKPIYILADDLGELSLPGYLRAFPIFSTSRLPEVIEELVRSAKPLGEKERVALVKVYTELGFPVDQILTRPEAMKRLTSGFRQLAGVRIPGIRLARELLRMRKTGSLRLAKTA